jgi:hypothetical protein
LNIGAEVLFGRCAGLEYDNTPQKDEKTGQQKQPLFSMANTLPASIKYLVINSADLGCELNKEAVLESLHDFLKHCGKDKRFSKMAKLGVSWWLQKSDSKPEQNEQIERLRKACSTAGVKLW